MISTVQAKKLCVKKYGELWGEKWVDERLGTIGDEWITPVEGNEFIYGIAQDDRLRNADTTWPPTFGGDTPSQHYTRFSVDLKTGNVTVTEHY